MGVSGLSEELIGELERRHVEFLRARITERPEDWVRLVSRSWDMIASLRIRDVVDAGRAARALRDVLTAQQVRGFFAPVVREVELRVVAAAQRDDTKLGDYVPAEARRAIDTLLERHDLIPDALVRKVFGEKIVEDAIENTLYDALTQFQTTVNPFFAEWGLPAILKRLPIGGSMILASMEGLRAEFDRRLEPEIRKFLVAFSRHTRGELAELFLSRSGDPKLAQLRKDVVAFLYTQSVAELTAGVDAQMSETAALVAESIVVHLAERDHAEAALRRAVAGLLDEHGDATIGEWLGRIGVSEQPAVESWAELSWPIVRGVLESDPVRDLLETITSEFYATLR